MTFVLRVFGWFLLSTATISASLSALALLWRRRHLQARHAGAPRPVSVLKPLFGAEPRLYENLSSFFTQLHPTYQLVFGLHTNDDPALAVIRRLQAEHPERDVSIVVDGRSHGVNGKVSNLINLYPAAKYDWLVIADSDISVPADYLGRVTAPLAEADVGVVTCIYRGRAIGGIWSRLGTQFIDEWFLPSVYLAAAGGSTRYGFGATIALRRGTLTTIGGFEALANQVADDYWLSELTRLKGLRTVLSDCEVYTDVTETRFVDLARHETRWLRTIRFLSPLSYAFSFVCFTLPVIAVGTVFTGFGPAALGVAAVGVLARLVLHCHARLHGVPPRTIADALKHLALFPVRDLLSLVLWAGGYGSTNVDWRGQTMALDTRDSARCST